MVPQKGHEYCFMTVKTLDDFRRKGDAESAMVTLKKPMPDRYTKYNGKRVITVPRHFVPEGEVFHQPTPEIEDFIRRHFTAHRWPLPEFLAA